MNSSVAFVHAPQDVNLAPQGTDREKVGLPDRVSIG